MGKNISYVLAFLNTNVAIQNTRMFRYCYFNNPTWMQHVGIKMERFFSIVYKVVSILWQMHSICTFKTDYISMIYIRRHRYNSRGQLLVRFEILDNASKLDDCFENHYINIKLSGKTDVFFFLKSLTASRVS